MAVVAGSLVVRASTRCRRCRGRRSRPAARSCSSAAACSSTSSRSSPSRAIGLLLLDGLPQQRRGGRRHADGRRCCSSSSGSCPGLEALQPYLLSTQFNAWQGLLRQPVDWAPIVRAAWVCALYARARAAWPRCSSSCAATSRAAERDARARPGGRRRRAGAADARRAAWPPRASRSRRVADGGAALAAAERSAPDLVVLDVTMPGPRRARGVPAPARQGPARLDPDAHGARRGGRPRRRPRGRRRRLPGQAVRDRGARRAAARARRGAGATTRDRLAFADLVLDLQHAHGRSAAGGRVELTGARERAARAAAAQRAAWSSRASGRSRRSGDEAAVPNVVDRYVARLRRKLGEPPLIHTVRGVGFMLRT